jgi:hypothetical protein
VGGEHIAGKDLLLSAPILTTSELPDTRTVTYTFQDSADNSSFSAIAGLATLVQTGADSAGAAATTRRVALPSNARQYVRVSVATGASTGDCSAKNMTLEVLL